jgi:tetratricopeptide (TPR) repeat protein
MSLLTACQRAFFAGAACLRPEFAKSLRVARPLRAAFLLGSYLVVRQTPRAGLASLDKAAAIEPGTANLQFFRGRALADLGRSKDALAAYQRETRKDDNPLFPFHRGLAYKQLKNYSAALADFDKSDAVHGPGRQVTRLHRGDI